MRSIGFGPPDPTAAGESRKVLQSFDAETVELFARAKLCSQLLQKKLSCYAAHSLRSAKLSSTLDGA